MTSILTNNLDSRLERSNSFRENKLYLVSFRHFVENIDKEDEE